MLQIGANRSVTLPQNVLLQKPHYAKYVHHIGQSGECYLYYRAMPNE